MKTKIKNYNPVVAFEPREGMSFRENVRKNPRTVVLVKPHGPRIWEARNEINGLTVWVPKAKMHAGPYFDGWSLVKPADALPENFGMIEVKGEF